ncbi:MAG: hypothetical protein KatS3mg013_1154 [Actinomycetota bacterium]|nr:MAG: hypothetical protein KatS3mg013_1154 [Actinomycetota bacterium]
MIAEVSQQVTAWWGPVVAFVAGALSFASPCVLPLVPGYVSFVTGRRVVADGPQREPIGRRLVPMLSFVAGFTTVFTAVGALATRLNVVALTRGPVGRWVLGGFVVLVGLLMLAYALGRGPAGVLSERRPLLERARIGSWGAFPVGMAFAAGWTPCVGPVLAAILGLAAAEESVARGVLLLVSYSAGLGLPFVLVGLGADAVLVRAGGIRRGYRWIAGASGALLVGLGLLLATGAFTRLVAPLQRFVPAL